VAVVERFDLCPWAAPATARGEVWIEACDEADVDATLARFAATDDAVVGLCVLPHFAGDLTALRRLRARLNEAPIGTTLALAEFHPDAPLDNDNPQRLIPFLRRSPDPLLQAVRHTTLATLRRPTAVLDPTAQASILAGHPVAVREDVGDRIAAVNFARMASDGASLAAALDELIAMRRADPLAAPRAIGSQGNA
jgi:hypothetical protein